jgi:thiamine biosynthesis lipoprotein
MRTAAICLLLAAACGRPAPEAVSRYEGASMGSSWHATVVHVADRAPLAPEELQDILDEVDRLMSTWKPESELSRFNAWAPGTVEESFPVSIHTAKVVAAALQVAEQTRGAFDPTVLPLVELWGFGASGPRADEPTPEEIAAAGARVGWQRLLVRGAALAKRDVRIAVDLSAIAPGYAADLICERLEALGFPNHLVEVGGEVRIGGRGPGGRPWRVGIEQPVDDAEQGEMLNAAIVVQDGAVATSGDYRKFRLAADGTRLSHEIDPRSGRPIAHALASATVLAPTCMMADAFATACMILGPAEALAFAERLPEVEAYLLVRTDQGFRALRTSGFPVPVE